jgi:hypothetical protein
LRAPHAGRYPSRQSIAELLTDAQVRAAMLLLNGGKVDLRRRARRKPRGPLKLERTCIDCGLTLPLTYISAAAPRAATSPDSPAMTSKIAHSVLITTS